MEIISEKSPLPIKLFEKGQPDAEIKIKYKLCFFAHSGPINNIHKLWTAKG